MPGGIKRLWEVCDHEFKYRIGSMTLFFFQPHCSSTDARSLKVEFDNVRFCQKNSIESNGTMTLRAKEGHSYNDGSLSMNPLGGEIRT